MQIQKYNSFVTADVPMVFLLLLQNIQSDLPKIVPLFPTDGLKTSHGALPLCWSTESILAINAEKHTSP